MYDIAGIASDISEDAMKACKIFAKAFKLREKYETHAREYKPTQNCHVLFHLLRNFRFYE